jgi:2-polyprenyl-6-methoxyphenol hydroxylase-like FAD-dependent oxidoreductase
MNWWPAGAVVVDDGDMSRIDVRIGRYTLTFLQRVVNGVRICNRDNGIVTDLNTDPVVDAMGRPTAAVWRRYDRVTHFPTGLVLIGEALCSLNPLYRQGMSMAAVQALALRDCLRSDDAGLAPRFFAAAARYTGPTWAMNQANDRTPSARSTSPSLRRRLTAWTVNATLKAAAGDITLTERFLRVNQLIDPPTQLQDPALIPRILRAQLRHPREYHQRQP